MTTSIVKPTSESAVFDEPRTIAAPRSRKIFDLWVALGYLLWAAFMAKNLFANLAVRSPSEAGNDHTFFQTMFAHGARVLFHGDNPFFTDRFNAPDGVNLMANTSSLGLTLPMAPVTALWGPHVSYAIVLVIGLAGTAYGWYWLLSRRIVTSKLAAIVGGAFCAFAPGMITHSQGHLNWTTQLLVPFIVDRILRLPEPGKVVRNGIILGLLATYEIFIAEEVLFYVGLATAVFGVAYAAFCWERVRPRLGAFLGGLGIALAIIGVLAAYPLYVQFAGPQSYHGIPSDGVGLGNDLLSFVSYSRRSLGGDVSVAERVGLNATEENAFFGWPLLLLAACIAGWLWREAAVRAALITATVFGILSLGPRIMWDGRPKNGVFGPWDLLDGLPLFDSVVPTRLSLIAIPCIALLLALAIDRVRKLQQGPGAKALRWIAAGALAGALVPLTPTPLPTNDHRLPPAFILDGTWKEYLRADQSLVVVAGPHPLDGTGMRWASRVGLELRVTDGYFIGPDGTAEKTGLYGAQPRPTRVLLRKVAETGLVPTISAADRAALRADLSYWRAGAVVVADTDPAGAQLQATLSELFESPGEARGGVHVWSVR